jgi:hypothetical protein
LGSLVEEDLLLASKSFKRDKKGTKNHNNLDSNDKEVEDLFKDSSDSSQDESKIADVLRNNKNTRKKCDVNFDDLMQASLATDFKPRQ